LKGAASTAQQNSKLASNAQVVKNAQNALPITFLLEINAKVKNRFVNKIIANIPL